MAECFDNLSLTPEVNPNHTGFSSSTNATSNVTASKNLRGKQENVSSDLRKTVLTDALKQKVTNKEES